MLIALFTWEFLQIGSAVLDKVDKLHLSRSSLRPKSSKSSTVVHRWLFSRLTEIKFNSKAKEKSICCSLTLELTGMEFVYFAAVTSKQLILGNISGSLQEFPNGIKVSLRKYV